MSTWWWLAQHLVTTSVLVAAVAVICRRLTARPALAHALWLVVLIKFLTPPLVAWPWTLSLAATTPLSQSDPSPKEGTGSTLSTEYSVLSTQTAVASTDFPPPDEVADNNRLRMFDPPHAPASGPEAAELPPPRSDNLAQTTAANLEARAPQVDRPWPFDWLAHVAIAAWVLGGLFTILFQLRRVCQHAAILRQSTAAPDHLAHEVRRLAASLGMRPIRVLLVRHMASPCVWCAGWLRLLWPEQLAAQQHVARYQGVIAHELAHVRRRDHWVAWLELLGGMIWWWNPVFWLVRRRLRESSEMACDALALSILPHDRFAYAEALLELSANKKTVALAPLLGISSAGTHQSFERRFSMILADHVSGKVSRGGLAAIVVLGLLALPHWTLGQAKAPPEESPAAAPATPASASAPATAAEPAVAVPAETDLKSDATTGEPQQLEARLQKIESTLQLILKRLEATDAKPNPKQSSLWATRSAPATDEGSGELARLAAEGQTFVVQLEQGRLVLVALEPETGKTIWRSELPEFSGDESATVRLEQSADKKFIQLQAEASGSATRLTVDPATGRITQMNVEGSANRVVPPRPAASPKPSTASTPPARGTYPATVAPVPNVPLSRYGDRYSGTPTNPMAAQAPPAAQLDLVNLATSYIDAQGAMKLAQARFEQLKLQPEGVLPKSELLAAAIQVETARSKVNVLKALVQSAHESAEAEGQHAEELYRKGYGTQSQAASARSRIKLLESILGSSGTSTSGESGSSGTSSQSLPRR